MPEREIPEKKDGSISTNKEIMTTTTNVAKLIVRCLENEEC